MATKSSNGSKTKSGARAHPAPSKSGKPQNAIQLLKSDHAEVKALFQRWSLAQLNDVALRCSLDDRSGDISHVRPTFAHGSPSGWRGQGQALLFHRFHRLGRESSRPNRPQINW